MNTHHSSESNEHYSPADVVEASRALMGRIDLDPASNALANERIIKATYFYDKDTNGFNKPWAGCTWLNPPGGTCDNEGRIIIRAKKATKTDPGRKSCKETGECGLPPGHTHKQPTSTMKAWWFKLAGEYMSGRVPTAVFLAFNMEILQTCQTKCFNSKGLPTIHKFPLCYPKMRLRFWAPNEEGDLEEGTQPTHGNVIAYLPWQWTESEEIRFKALFGDIGECVWPSEKVMR